MRLAALLCLIPSVALADDNRCVDVQFTPTDKLQIVAWVETAEGQYVDTLYITQQTGSFGLGNRPGRFDFNSGPLWPYGRRITTFPVWSHRHGVAFPYVMFQDDKLADNTDFQDPFYCDSLPANSAGGCGEYGLSHPFNQSSSEAHFCQPLQEHQGGWDTGTCATMAYTDKGRFSTDLTKTTGYPPRADLARTSNDAASVEMYKMMNPFDAVSQPTPVGGSATHAPWAVTMGAGDYVMYVETSKESDMNASYNATNYPSPSQIAFGNYGVPYRGQPSVVYRVPFTVSASITTAAATDYYGYGDPTGKDGSVRPPDATITVDTPGSGGARLQLVSDGNQMYRVRVTIDPNEGGQPPSAPTQLAVTDVHTNDLSVAFVAPGTGTGTGTAHVGLGRCVLRRDRGVRFDPRERRRAATPRARFVLAHERARRARRRGVLHVRSRLRGCDRRLRAVAPDRPRGARADHGTRTHARLLDRRTSLAECARLHAARLARSIGLSA